ncbi:MAG: response regulator transcription factor [Saprospiraceae bacterium]|nr:response regulator transcription factor [Saprospiraceae bacterium]
MSTIFYVEDEVFLAKIIKDSLESRGYTVIWAANGKEALDKFPNAQADISVLDVMLPHIDGFELGRKIKELNPDIPIIYLTAKDQTKDVLQGFEAGANDYIRKPCSIEELIIRVENLLQLTNVKTPTTNNSRAERTIGQFVFYPKKYTLVFQGDQKISLSHKETELLKLFSSHINQKITRHRILDTVWGDDSFFNSRNLDVYITKLRQYFKADPKIKIITLRGVGYHFLVEN